MNIPSVALDNSKKISLLFLGSQMTTGGAQRVLLDQANWFASRGYRVIAAFLYDKDDLYEQWQATTAFPLINLNSWGPGNRLKNVYRLLRGMLRLYRLMVREQFCAVETFTHHANLIGLPIAWVANVPLRIATHHGGAEGFPGWVIRVHQLVTNAGIATSLVAVSEHVRRQALTHERIRADRILVIPNGIDVNTGEKFSHHERRKLRLTLGIEPDDFLVLTVGRLQEPKGHVFLLEAIPAVLESFPNTVFAFAGEGQLREDLESKARSLDITAAVHFLGNRPDIPSLLGVSDCFVLPSIWEGLPIALLEAMAAGLPVVATKVGGIEEVVTDNRNGLLVEPANPMALSRAIIQLLSSEEHRKHLGSAGKALVNEKYTLDQMCLRYEQLFQSTPEVGEREA